MTVIGMGFTGCERELIETAAPQKQTVLYSQCDGGVEDYEDIILTQQVRTPESDPIPGASAELWASGRSTPEATETSGASGNCVFNDSSGCYYFITNAAGYQKDTSSPMLLLGDTTVVTVLQPI